MTKVRFSLVAAAAMADVLVVGVSEGSIVVRSTAMLN